MGMGMWMSSRSGGVAAVGIQSGGAAPTCVIWQGCCVTPWRLDQSPRPILNLVAIPGLANPSES